MHHLDMQDSRTSFTDFFNTQKKSLGIRLDILEHVELFRSRQSIENLMAFLSECGVKFLNIGTIFAQLEGKQVSSFAIDENLLTSAIFDKDFSASSAIDFAIKFFNETKHSELRTEFAKFCEIGGYWLDTYSLFCAISKQVDTNNFSKWPDILRLCSHKTRETLKKQLADEIMRHKIIQFFAGKQLKLIKDLANGMGIFLCGDCDILCESFAADVWADQKIFYVNDLSRATIFTGLPASDLYGDGRKTTKVPYRIGNLKSTHYDFFEHLFSRWQGLFDAIFLLNSHAIFQYWEIARDEPDPKQGRWVNLPTDMFFEYLDSHFNYFPYFSDFNEPLLRVNEVALKQRSILQMVVDGEPKSHISPSHDLRREIFAVESRSCNRKLGKIKITPDLISAHAQSCLKNFKSENWKLCVLDFDEICNISGFKSADVQTRPKACGETVFSATRTYFQ
jgi:hypothetical protein